MFQWLETQEVVLLGVPTQKTALKPRQKVERGFEKRSRLTGKTEMRSNFWQQTKHAKVYPDLLPALKTERTFDGDIPGRGNLLGSKHPTAGDTGLG